MVLVISYYALHIHRIYDIQQQNTYTCGAECEGSYRQYTRIIKARKTALFFTLYVKRI